MALPAKQNDSAEQVLGTTSLEMVRGRVIRNIYDNPDLTGKQRKRIIEELDCLIENERDRRAQLVVYQSQREELDHRLTVANKQADIYQRYADVISKLRLLKAQTEYTVTKYNSDGMMLKMDVAERLLELRARYKPVEKKDDYHQEMSKVRRQQKVSDAREDVILNGIAKRAMRRAAFVKMVNEKYPDMADELIDNYDQQIYQQGIRR